MVAARPVALVTGGARGIGRAITGELGSDHDLAVTCHAHPTLAEALKEASLAVNKEAIHA